MLQQDEVFIGVNVTPMRAMHDVIACHNGQPTPRNLENRILRLTQQISTWN